MPSDTPTALGAAGSAWVTNETPAGVNLSFEPGRTSQATGLVNATAEARINSNATKTMSAMRILFGTVFLFDGILKWVLLSNGQMQSVIQGFGYDFLSNNWLSVGVLVGIGETAGGILLMLGIFQRPAAAWSAAIMFAIWALGGYGGAYLNGTWSLSGYTDPGGDLMLALVFVVLIFTPYAYGLASHWHLRDRLSGPSLGRRILRYIVT